ncbi:MAG: toll/interleukin-1 receptor domain-containing protein, partial [Epsilonproteobacteria bacterium]|nr:toll/interleukin-1 receptor domain-containing protein [Campylobacterota bacterium]
MYFISYSSKDSNIVEKYVKKLKSKVDEKNVWFAPKDIKSSEFYANKIVKAIDKSKAFLLFLSKNSLESSHVLRELNLAVSKGKK